MPRASTRRSRPPASTARLKTANSLDAARSGLWIAVVGSFAGSVLGNLVVNPTLYSFGILTRWSPGMSAIPASISNQFDFWLSFGIGSALVIAVIVLVGYLFNAVM